jgi:hypothetical protein
VQLFCIASTYASHRDFAQLRTYWDRSMARAQVLSLIPCNFIDAADRAVTGGVRITERSRQP